MLPENVRKLLKKQHYRIVGKKGHSAVQICRWTKKSIKDEGVCYKEKFYGIKSHLCCQMTPAVMWCPNKCIHCWRAIEHTVDSELPTNKEKLDSPKEIIDSAIEAQRELLQGFKINPKTKSKSKSKANMEKWKQAQEPMQFAISLSGEPTVYPMIREMIGELRKRGKSSFLVTNGLYPEKLEEIYKKGQMPTQLYISINSPNKEHYKKFHRSSKKDAWERLNATLELLPKLNKKTRTVFRMNIVREINLKDEFIGEYARLIEKSKPRFIEIKGFMSVGFARQRLGYNMMPTHTEIKNFAAKLAKELNDKKIGRYNILDEQKVSRVVVLGKSKKELKIKTNEI